MMKSEDWKLETRYTPDGTEIIDPRIANPAYTTPAGTLPAVPLELGSGEVRTFDEEARAYADSRQLLSGFVVDAELILGDQ